MKDKLLTIIAVVLFLLTLAFGGALLLGAMLIIIPLSLLHCMFVSKIQDKNEGI